MIYFWMSLPLTVFGLAVFERGLRLLVCLFFAVNGKITGSPRVKSNRLKLSVIVRVIFCMAAFVRVGIYLFIMIYFFWQIHI